MALAHKGLSAETVPWRFTEKSAIAPHGAEKVPVLLDGDKPVADSWAIAKYLEDTYPERPSLFGGEGGRAMARMLNWWGDSAWSAGMFPMIVADIPLQPEAGGRGLFPQKPRKHVSASRWKRLPAATRRSTAFRKRLDPLRLTLRTQPYHRRRGAELCRLYRVRRVSVGAGGQPVQAADGRRSDLCLARAAARRVRRHGAPVARLSRLAPAAGAPLTRRDAVRRRHGIGARAGHDHGCGPDKFISRSARKTLLCRFAIHCLPLDVTLR